MDLSTEYLGLSLPNPFIAGPSPLTDHLDTVKQLEDAGIAAVVLPVLFEEQLRNDQMQASESIDAPAESFAEALSYFAEPERSVFDEAVYLEHLAMLKRGVHVPIIGAINAVTPAKWTGLAAGMEQAGADALELDFYYVANDASESSEAIEGRMIDALRSVKQRVRIPVSVKLTPFHTSLAHFARNLEAAGADGLTLLHRFYEPDLDLDNLQPFSRLQLSDPRELLLRLRWLAIISGNAKCSLAACGGVHTAEDTVKAVMTGAHCVQVCSALIRNGIAYVKTLHKGLAEWLERNEYDSVRQMRGTMNLNRIPDPKVLSREHYMHLLRQWDSSWEAERGLGTTTEVGESRPRDLIAAGSRSL